jgi:hypothetical protein
MQRLVLWIALIAGLGVSHQMPAAAQSGVGLYAGTDVGRANQVVGLEARVEVVTFPMLIASSVETSVAEGGTQWQLNASLLYRHGEREAMAAPYMGGGVSLVRQSNGASTDVGANAVAGIRLLLGPLQPFVQTRATVSGNTHVTLSAGLLIRAG